MFSKFKYLVIGLLIILAGLGVYAYSFLFSDNIKVEKTFDLKIREGNTFKDILDTLKQYNVVENLGSFDKVAQLMKYSTNIKPGRYEIKPSMSNKEMITKLRSGDQDPINLTFNNVWTIQELAGKLSLDLSTDSITLLNAFLSGTALQKFNKTPENILSLFIPNSYDVFWNIDPMKLMERMESESNKFWSEERMQKAKAINLSKEQVYTLASIVQRESNNKKERPTVAGVYLNRLNIGDKLRADPTVVFANNDFTIKRVLNKHLTFDSPYNTYMYAGLPPGPIFMPSTNAIDAVLNAEKHEYLFFCAKPGYNSEHAFAKTDIQHLQNAKIYHAWLTSEGIK
jgi:UPF0755 protein